MPKILSEEEKQMVQDRLKFLDEQISKKAKELSSLRQERTKLRLRRNWYRKYSPNVRKELCQK